MSYKRILVVLFLGVLMGSLDISVVGPALQSLKLEFGINDRHLPWLINGYYLAASVFGPVLSSFADMRGRKPIFMLSVVLFAIGSIMVTWANSFELLLLGRVVQGIGGGGLFPSASAVIFENVPESKQGQAMGLIGSVFGFAFIVGPLLGGLLLPISWRLIFAINLPISLFILVMAYFVIPKPTKPEVVRKPDYLGLFILGLSVFLFIFGVNKIDTTNFLKSITDWSVLPFLAIGAVLLPLFYWLEKRNPDPAFKPVFFNKRNLIMPLIVAYGAGMVNAASIFIPSFAKISFNLSDSKSSYILIPMMLGLFIAAPIVGRLVDKIGPWKIIIVAQFLAIITYLLLYIGMPAMWQTYTVLFALGVAFSGTMGSPIRILINRYTPKTDTSAAQSVIGLFFSSGSMIGSALIGALIASKGGAADAYHTVFLYEATAAIVFLPLILFVIPRK